MQTIMANDLTNLHPLLHDHGRHGRARDHHGLRYRGYDRYGRD